METLTRGLIPSAASLSDNRKLITIPLTTPITMPISTVIHLSPPEDVTLRPTMGHHAHAVFFTLLRIGNPKKAKEVHAESAQKPFTVSPLIAKGTRHRDRLHLQAGTECKLRFTFLSDALFAHFAPVFFSNPLPSIHLGQATFQINRLITTSPETDDWGRMTTYEELIDAAEQETRMQIRFYSPTAFRALTPRGQDRRDEAAIDLVRCYQSWVNKWNAFAPMQIDKRRLLDFVTDHAGLTAIDSENRVLDFGRNKIRGFIGSCAYQFFIELQAADTPDLEMLRWVNLLADFAFYCGTGYKTTMGMGQTRRY